MVLKFCDLLKTRQIAFKKKKKINYQPFKQHAFAWNLIRSNWYIVTYSTQFAKNSVRI